MVATTSFLPDLHPCSKLPKLLRQPSVTRKIVDRKKGQKGEM